MTRKPRSAAALTLLACLSSGAAVEAQAARTPTTAATWSQGERVALESFFGLAGVALGTGAGMFLLWAGDCDTWHTRGCGALRWTALSVGGGLGLGLMVAGVTAAGNELNGRGIGAWVALGALLGAGAGAVPPLLVQEDPADNLAATLTGIGLGGVAGAVFAYEVSSEAGRRPALPRPAAWLHPSRGGGIDLHWRF